MKVSKVSEMREMDRRAIQEFSIPEEILMENAGGAVCSVIKNEFGIRDKRFVIFCGSGNNGGDGFVIARKLHSDGGSVKVFLLTQREKYQGAARKNLDIFLRLPVDVKEIGSAEEVKEEVVESDVIVDAIFGTGLEREVTGLQRDVISLINGSRKKAFAVDIPSGINGDTAQEMGISVQADYTVAFGLPKVGNLLYPGFGRGGKLYVSHISFPPSLHESDSLKIEIGQPVALPERDPNKNKMDYGPVLVIAGAATYFWAPHASAYSVLRAGGGYVFLACPQSLAPVIAQSGKEIVFQPQKETPSGSIALQNLDSLLELSRRMKMVVIGPGLSLNEETQELVRELATKIDRPLLIDGDGITAISRQIDLLKARKAPTVLTPHMGEMARITGLERAQLEQDRMAALQETANRLNAIIVLKGAHSLIGYPDGKVFINVSGATGGRAGMATAGMGDVLNGTIAAMFCLGLDIGEAVRAGVFIHGLAGDMAAEEKGPDGMTAQDVLDSLPYAVQYYRENLDEIAETVYDKIHVV